MRIAFYGSSLLSSYWNGAATYYRGILRALASLGHDIVFFEPDAHDRQSHRDFEPPEWCRVIVYPATFEGLTGVLAQATQADVVVKASGVGYADDALLSGALATARTDAIRIFWDVDAPATLADITAHPDASLRTALPDLDLVLTYGGGQPVIDAYRALGARSCVPIYNALDPITHHPVPRDPRLVADMTFLGNRLPDREERVERFLLGPASAMPDHRFILGGSGWNDKPAPSNVVKLGHVGTGQHNALNASARAVLNISRADMASTGFSPATRVFEAAGAGACLITDDWPGIDQFLSPGREILVARDGADVVELLSGLTAARAASIGEAALRRVLAEHTYDRRALTVDRLLHECVKA